MLLFVSAWLVGWAFGEVTVIREVLVGGANAFDLFLAVWLIMWTIGGGVAIYTWLRMVAGRELVRLGGGFLVIKGEVFGLGRPREYDLTHIKNLRVDPLGGFPWDMARATRFWGTAGGPIAFDYGARTVTFGAGLDDAEARTVIEDLRAQQAFREP